MGSAPPPSVIEVITAEGGRVTFARFMEVALTHPTVGYYSRVERLLRREGDFSTAPALSPFFNRTLARLVTELLEASLAEAATGPHLGAGADCGAAEAGADCGAAEARADRGAAGSTTGGAAEAKAGSATGSALVRSPPRAAVIELGGGEAQLAAAVLGCWERERPELRDEVTYRIVEVGPGLRRRQAAAVEPWTSAGWEVGWGAAPAEAGAGARPVVVLGNEFLDAIPVHLVALRGGSLREAYVVSDGESLVFSWGPVSAAAGAEIDALFGTRDPQRLSSFTEDGVLELFPGLRPLLKQVAELMPCGSLLTIDYGEWFSALPQPGPAWELEGRSRRRRSLRGYFRHQLVDDLLARAGKQDLTADVDFAAVDLHGRGEGFETVLFTTLAAFLRAGGAEAELDALAQRAATMADDAIEADRQATVLKNLLDERDLGGTFKLMLQVRE